MEGYKKLSEVTSKGLSKEVTHLNTGRSAPAHELSQTGFQRPVVKTRRSGTHEVGDGRGANRGGGGGKWDQIRRGLWRKLKALDSVAHAVESQEN